jgi:hypothetical protein
MYTAATRVSDLRGIRMRRRSRRVKDGYPTFQLANKPMLCQTHMAVQVIMKARSAPWQRNTAALILNLDREDLSNALTLWYALERLAASTERLPSLKRTRRVCCVQVSL